MIIIIDTDQIVAHTLVPAVITHSDGTVFLNGTFQEVGIAEVLQYQVEKAVADATDYHYETYHADDAT